MAAPQRVEGHDVCAARSVTLSGSETHVSLRRKSKASRICVFLGFVGEAGVDAEGSMSSCPFIQSSSTDVMGFGLMWMSLTLSCRSFTPESSPSEMQSRGSRSSSADSTVVVPLDELDVLVGLTVVPCGLGRGWLSMSARGLRMTARYQCRFSLTGTMMKSCWNTSTALVHFLTDS